MADHFGLENFFLVWTKTIPIRAINSTNKRDIRAVLFWDTGNVFEKFEAFESSDIRSSIGIGLRLKIPALGPMPLALDFAKPVRKQDGDELDHNIGHHTLVNLGCFNALNPLACDLIIPVIFGRN